MSSVISDPVEKQDILDNLPNDAVRIKIEDDLGKKKWRDIDSLHDTDSICLKLDGSPYLMNTKPGRKKVPQVDDSKGANEQVKELMQEKAIKRSQDPLLKTVKSDPDSQTILDGVIEGIAEEAFSLHFERVKAEREGEETSAISVRRVNALKSLAETYLKKRDQFSTRSVDMDSLSFKVLFTFILETFRDVMEQSNVRPEMVDTVFAKLTKRLDNSWEDEAKNKMRNSTK